MKDLFEFLKALAISVLVFVALALIFSRLLSSFVAMFFQRRHILLFNTIDLVLGRSLEAAKNAKYYLSLFIRKQRHPEMRHFWVSLFTQKNPEAFTLLGSAFICSTIFKPVTFQHHTHTSNNLLHRGVPHEISHHDALFQSKHPWF